MAKRFLKILLWIGGILIVISLLLAITGNAHILRGLRSTYLIGEARPDIDDMRFHDVRKVACGTGINWKTRDPLLRLSEVDMEYHKSLGTVAYLVFHKGELLSETYFDGFGQDQLSNSFSMAKSFLAVAVGAAIQNGDLPSLDARVGDYLHDYNSGLDSLITIKHLLQMSSGIDFGESYTNPFGYQAKAYFGRDLEKLTTPFHASLAPGEEWKYEGGNSVILSLVLQKATGQNLSDYFSEHVWKPIGAEHDAYWNLDREDGLEKSFSAFYATARDFAKIGQLYMDSGRVGGQQIVPEFYIAETSVPVNIADRNGELARHYGLHWWLGEMNGRPFYSCRGMRGQYIACVPHLNMVMVRLGHSRVEVYENGASLDLYRFLDMGKSLIKNEGRH